MCFREPETNAESDVEQSASPQPTDEAISIATALNRGEVRVLQFLEVNCFQFCCLSYVFKNGSIRLRISRVWISWAPIGYQPLYPTD